jgi:hypothetical protein
MSPHAVNAITKEIAKFHDDMVGDPNHRFRSWEHCYKYFQGKPNDFDLASLHLAFFLASWGMYRGSSFLLQKDYLIHRAAVEEILSPQYSVLHRLSFDAFLADGKMEVTDVLFDLLRRVKACYKDVAKFERGMTNVTDTLATKILLGTLGCIPAYDRYFILGLKACGLRYSYLNKKNFLEMMHFCLGHREEFRRARAHISKHGRDYPDMKVADMYFWSLGRARDGNL